MGDCSYAPSTAPIDTLKKVFVKEMILGAQNRGCYVLLRLAPSQSLHSGIGVGADEIGNIVGFRIILQNGRQVYNEYLGDAQFIIIKEPRYIVLPDSAGGYISIYHISDIVVLSPSDPRLPQTWTLDVKKTIGNWRLAGNQAVREKRFHRAINCYNQALSQAPSPGDLRTLRLNRCHARLSVQCFDTALEDANAVLKSFPDNEKALFRKAEAFYHLRQFKDSLETLDRLTTLFPNNKIASQRLQRVRDRLQEEAGNYDFPAMLKEASKPARLDRASFIGCVEVRECEDKSRGRGLFLTKPVKVGELLLCEKAFSVSLMSIREDIDQGAPGDGVNTARNEIIRDCVFQLHRNPSQISIFTALHSGSCEPENREPKKQSVDGQPIINGVLINSIVRLNCYKFSQSRDYHSRFNRADPDLLSYPSSAGVWIFASYINHTCLSNVERAFIGDMIVIRAAQNLAAGSELTHNYVSILDGYEERQSRLTDYGFQCDCRRCQIDKETLVACRQKRCQIINELEMENRVLSMSSFTIVLKEIERLLEEFDATFTLPASQIPRIEAFMELYITILNLHGWDRSAEVVTMACRLLTFSGFLIRIIQTSFRITQWGSVTGFTVMGLAYMWKAFGKVNPSLCDDVEEALKLAYKVVVGEGTSFEDVYGDLRPLGKNDAQDDGARVRTSILEGSE